MFHMIRRNGATATATPFGHLLDELFEGPSARKNWLPVVDFVETPEAYVAHIELPGVDPASVELELEDRRLEIRGEKKVERKEEGESWHRVERVQGAFRRALRLPADVDASDVSATAEHGVLTIRLPKREEAKARRIQIDLD